MADAPGRCLIVHRSACVRDAVQQELALDGWVVAGADSSPVQPEQIRRCNLDVLVVAAMYGELLALEHPPAIVLARRGDPPAALLDLGAAAVCFEEPLRAHELRARARALLRRARGDAPFGARRLTGVVRGVEVDIRRHRATLDGVAVSLTPSEFALLSALAGAQGELVTRAALSGCIWGATPPPSTTRALDAHAARLKRKLGPRGGCLIQTVWGLGYRLEQPDRACASRVSS